MFSRTIFVSFSILVLVVRQGDAYNLHKADGSLDDDVSPLRVEPESGDDQQYKTPHEVNYVNYFPVDNEVDNLEDSLPDRMLARSKHVDCGRSRLLDRSCQFGLQSSLSSNGEDYAEFNSKGVGYNDYCINDNVTLYRNFDDIVRKITEGITVDNTNDHKCLHVGETFVLYNCSNLNFYYVPDTLDNKMSALDLSHNSIATLGGMPFRKYSNMKYLTLAYNNLLNLDINSFRGLHQLLVLDLRGNLLEMKDGVFPVGVFKSLPSLVALRINRNTKHPNRSGLSYPDVALSDLKSLKFLSMDGLKDNVFGEGFAKLEQLESLSLVGYTDGYCQLVPLLDNTFPNLRQLRMLNISDCGIDAARAHPEAFYPLVNLQSLDLSWNEYLGLQKTMQIIKVFYESDLKELFIKRVESRFHAGSRIDMSYSQLPKNLTCLIVSGNNINSLDPNVLNNLPSTLLYLDFSGNKMVFGKYVERLWYLDNLKVLKLNGFDTIFTIPNYYPDTDIGSPLLSTAVSTGIGEDKREESNSEIVLPIPPNAIIFTMEYAELKYVLGQLHINETNSLQELYLENNYLPMLIGPFRGFKKLKILVLKSCQISYISKRFFEDFPSLELLDLYHNQIGLGSGLNFRPFQYLSNLTYLNLGYNAISSFKHDTFHGLTSLNDLRLEYNRFRHFNASISHMKNLEILDLNLTDISTLPPETRRHIDSLKNITVFTSMIPIDCDCPNIEFLIWFAASTKIATNSDVFCVQNSRSAFLLSNRQFVSKVKLIKRECTHNYDIFLVVLAMTLLLMGLITGSILYRFRHRLRYLYYSMQIWMTQKTPENTEHEFQYDVFISYASEDLNFIMRKVVPELHKRDMKLCIHSRDFDVGGKVISNIIRAVKDSKRTLVILTSNFINSKWCRAEFQMAKEESVISGRNILIFLIAEKIPKSKIGLELLNHIQQNTYIPYQGKVDNRELGPVADDDDEEPTSSTLVAMWDKLVRDITK